MKATGIVRRIDDLGRVVIPKEIRRTLRLREGTPLEIFTDREGEIILKKVLADDGAQCFCRTVRGRHGPGHGAHGLHHRPGPGDRSRRRREEGAAAEAHQQTAGACDPGAGHRPGREGRPELCGGLRRGYGRRHCPGGDADHL